SWLRVGDRLLFLASTDSRYYLLGSLSPDGPVEILAQSAYFRWMKDLQAFSDGAVFLQSSEDPYEVWQTDGTAAGTHRLFELPASPQSSNPGKLLRHGESLFMSTEEFSHVRLWATDGVEGAAISVDLGPGDSRLQLRQLASNGEELLVSTSEGYYRISPSGEKGELLFPREGGAAFLLQGRQLFFSRADEEVGIEPWVGDVKTGESRLLRDLAPGTVRDHGGLHPRHSSPGHFTAFANAIYFFGRDGAAEPNLWRTDGSAAGTVSVGVVPPLDTSGGETLVATEDQLFLVARQGIWVLGRSEASAREVLRFPPSSWVKKAVAFRDRLLFVESHFRGTTPELLAPAPLWSTDGTAAGTREVFRSDLPWVEPEELTAAGLTLYFTAQTAGQGRELWATDGTAEGTRLVKDIAPGPASSEPRDLRAVAGRLFFSADDGIHGQEPWVSDGTEEGTRLLADVDEGPLASFPREFTPMGDEIFFSAQRSDAGRELFALERPAALRCQPSERRLCLHEGRLGVELDWSDPQTRTPGIGQARSWSDTSGSFAVSQGGSADVVVKALDAHLLNGSFWFFSGGVSEREVWVTATDFSTGRTRTFHHLPGDLCGQVAFSSFGDEPLVPTQTSSESRAPTPPGPGETAALPDETCPVPLDAHLLQGNRFAVQVRWQTRRGGGRQGTARPASSSEESATYSFFRPENLDLLVQVLDRRQETGHFQVRWGALTDVAYQIDVTDLSTCELRTYTHSEGDLCGGSDAAAF
ncbi:MAG: hypothetical protein KDD47_16120, partial [Acidobacteria bacterium]|nr:hypothetical protein [Acidobacteriota bacterium]